jgi:hypothetical protein
MGSDHATTCALSDLPIELGTEVRYLLLTRNPYTALLTAETPNCFYASDLWFPRTFPLKALYGDGGIQKVEEGPKQQVWLDGFQFDLIPNKRTGVPERQALTFPDLLSAVIRGVVVVDPRPEITVPVVSAEEAEVCRQLRETPSALPNLPVSHAIFREDVYQSLLNLDVTDSPYGFDLTLADMKALARKVWDTFDRNDYLQVMEFARGVEKTFTHQAIPGLVGLGISFRLAMQRREEMTAEQVDAFLDSAAELLYVESLFPCIRYYWRPSYFSGTADGEWGIVRNWCEALREIAAAERDRKRTCEATDRIAARHKPIE